MILTSRTLVFTSLGLAASAGVLWLVLSPRSAAEVRVPGSAPRESRAALAKGTPVGMTGCLSSACHGGPAADTLAGKFDANTWQASGTCWAARDPHARAHDALTRPLARDMMAKLGSASPATDDARCLACHTNPSLAADSRFTDLRREGVSCEACHGNAGGWLREHTRWGDDRRSVYAATGMTPLFDIGERAKTCLGCHLGAPADPVRGYPVRDMNHDMIAAGHPRLNFDFAEYHRRLPRHWAEARAALGPLERDGDWEAMRWTFGVFARGEAAALLLADRAARANADEPRTPWPEFAEFNCYSCHHTIPEPGRTDPAAGRVAGSLRWQPVWPLTRYWGWAEPALRHLLEVMEAPRPAGPARVEPLARSAAAGFARLRDVVGVEPGSDRRWLELVFSRARPGAKDPDELVQMLLARSALERVRSPGRPPPQEFERAFDAIRRKDWPAAREAMAPLLHR